MFYHEPMYTEPQGVILVIIRRFHSLDVHSIVKMMEDIIQSDGVKNISWSMPNHRGLRSWMDGTELCRLSVAVTVDIRPSIWFHIMEWQCQSKESELERVEKYKLYCYNVNTRCQWDTNDDTNQFSTGFSCTACASICFLSSAHNK